MLSFFMLRSVFALLFLASFQYSAAAASPENFHCNAGAHEPFLDQANRFILTTLRYSPVEATQAGYHGDPSAPLDNQLDDSSRATIAAERALFIAGKLCFAAAKQVHRKRERILRSCATTSSPLSFRSMCCRATATARRIMSR